MIQSQGHFLEFFHKTISMELKQLEGLKIELEINRIDLIVGFHVKLFNLLNDDE